MVVAPAETAADVIFVIEGTAINGAYLGDIRTNYIVPALEFFNQGTLEEREYGCEGTTAQYGIIIYHAADRLPSPSTDIFGPYSNPHKLLQTLDKIELVGGNGESQANVAEGLAVALQCLDDLAQRRDSGAHSQKHCILICNSPPYLMPVMENQNYTGNTAEQMAALLNEKGIHLSILSPRKIPAMYKLFEKSGGDLGACQTKNYAKDPRNLVLLKGFSLKERPVSPTNTAGSATHIPIGMPSPLQSHGSPMAPAAQAQPPQPVQTQPPILTNVAPNPGMVVAPQASGAPGRGYPPAYVRPNSAQPNRWPMMPPQGPRYPNESTLIAQLSRPPTAIPPQFNNTPGMAPSPGQPQQQQLANPQGQQPQLTNPQGQQQLANPQGQQQQPQQAQQQANQMRILGAQQGMPQGGLGQPQPGGVLPASTQQSMIGQQPNVAVVMSQPGLINQGPQMTQGAVMQPQPSQGPGMPQPQGPQSTGNRERQTIWQGVIEWIDKKSPNDSQKTTRHVPCQVSTAMKDGEPELKADAWPQKLIMQLMPKQLIGSIGGSYLKNSKSVLFHLQPSEAMEALTKVMSSGFAGCVHFNSVTQCDIKVLILLYTAEKRAFLGFIPNDQVAFVDRLRRVIQHSKSTHAMNRQGQAGQAGGAMAPGPPQNSPQPSMAGMLQNPMAQQQGQQINNNMGVVGQQGGQIMGQMQQDQNQQQPAPGQPGSFNNPLVEARNENLVKIQRLRQTLEAAQQQENLYKNQLEDLPVLGIDPQTFALKGEYGNYYAREKIMNQMKMQHQQQPQMQEGVGMHPGQSQDQFKQQIEMTLGYQQEQQKQLRAQLQQIQAQQAQQQQQLSQQQLSQQQQVQQQQQQQQQVQQQQLRGMAPVPQAGPPQQRMIRPNISNNPGLRHLLQQPQYRINMQQQMPRAGMPTQPGQQPPNQQQFEEQWPGTTAAWRCPSSTQQSMIGQQPNVAVVMSQPGLINQGPQMTQGAVMQPQPSQGPGMPQPQGPQSTGNRERQTIWQGVIEWIDKKSPNDSQKTTRHVPCQVSTAMKDGEPELKADGWPQKLIMQLMPKQLIGSIGGSYLKNSKSVLFHLQPSEAMEALTKVMSCGFAGCVHFNSVTQCDIKVLILLYTAEKRAFLGFIPNDQVAFMDRLRRVIQHSKSTHAMNRQMTLSEEQQKQVQAPHKHAAARRPPEVRRAVRLHRELNP